MKKLFCAFLVLFLLCGTVHAESDKAYGGNDRVFYEIFVGSFSDSDGDGVGDLRGIINRLDYLNNGDPESMDSLGVEGIWLTPIFASPSYHKYDVTDFYAVDPAFGTLEDLKELIQGCHERGIKLILDLPINHTGKENRWFKSFLSAHATNNDRSDYYDFYVWLPQGESQPAGRHFAKAGGVQYEANFSDAMPEPDFDNPLVRSAMLKVALYYLELGVDGFRFDAAKYIYYGDNQKSAEFWDWYIGELKKVKIDLYTVSEVWDGESVIDTYLPITNCFHFALSQVDGLIAETAKSGNVNRFAQYMQRYIQHVKGLNPDGNPVLFIANHDTDRAAGYLTVASGQMKMAASLYLLSPGSPFIYYGEEIGLRGSRGGANTDANRRLAMLWGDGDTVENPVGSTYDQSKQTPYSVKDLEGMRGSLLSHYKKLTYLRRHFPAIARGTYTALNIPDSKLGGFVCELDGSRIAVFHNTTNRVLSVDLSTLSAIPFASLEAALGDGEVTLDGQILTMDGQTTAILQ